MSTLGWQAKQRRIRYGLYDLEVSCLDATQGGQRRSRLQDCHLCLITSPCEDLLDRVAIALSHGVAMVQFRQKDGGDHERLTLATALRQLCNQHGALFIVNDRIDLALAVDADGVHLGQDDLPTEIARRLLGPERLLGRSTHNLEQVREANSEDCDYLGLGPVHDTAVKPSVPQSGELVGEALTLGTKPVFAIGGINVSNLAALTARGCRHVAVIGAIMGAADPGQAARDLLDSLSQPVA